MQSVLVDSCELLHRFMPVFFCVDLSVLMTQAYFLLTCRIESEPHNRRKLPPLSHKADVLLQDVQVHIGNITFHYSMKVPDPNTAAVYSCSESERSSGRCPRLLWYPET